MLVTECVGENYKMLVTVLAVLVTNIYYLFTLASGTNIQKMSPTSKFCHQQPKNFTSFKSPTSLSRIFWYDERFIEDVRIIIDLFRQTLSIVIAVHTQILKMISNWMRLICQILGTGWGCKMKGFRKNLRQLALKKYMQQTVFKTLLKLYWSEKLITSDNW